MTAAKRKGTAFESAVRDRLAGQLGRVVHRLAQHGSRDIGDIAIEGVDVTVECKAAKAIELGSWMTETLAEQTARGTRWGVLVVKRRMRPIGESYVVMTLDQWADLTDAAHWRPEPERDERPTLVAINDSPEVLAAVGRHPAGAA